jgi:hypothetical protein
MPVRQSLDRQEPGLCRPAEDLTPACFDSKG